MPVETIDIDVDVALDNLPATKTASSIYSIDRDELISMVERKLLKQNSPLFVYFALMLDYPNGAKELDIAAFCNKWTIYEDKPLSESDVAIAVAQMEKKQIISQQHKQLAFVFTYPDD